MRKNNFECETFYDPIEDNSIQMQYALHGKKPLVMCPITSEMIRAQREEELEEEARTEWFIDNCIWEDDPWGCYDC